MRFRMAFLLEEERAPFYAPFLRATSPGPGTLAPPPDLTDHALPLLCRAWPDAMAARCRAHHPGRPIHQDSRHRRLPARRRSPGDRLLRPRPRPQLRRRLQLPAHRLGLAALVLP